MSGAPLRPMLASPADRDGPPVGADWVYEVKWDGIRVLVEITEGGLTIRSRAGRDITAAFPELSDLAKAHPDALIDGEAVAFEDGRPSFARVVERVHVTDPRRAAEVARENPVTLFAFDVLRLYGVDLTRRPWSERRQTLERIESPLLQGDFPGWRLSPVYDDGAALLAATEAQGLEGVVAKRRTSLYQPGRRTPDWVKYAHRSSVTCLVGGWRPESTGANRVGSLLVGIRNETGLRFLGRVGSGMTGRIEAELRSRLVPLAIDRSPFEDDIPRADTGSARWCRPEVSVEVSYLGHELPAPGARLRAPVLRGLRAAVDLDEADDDPAPPVQ